MRSKLTSAAFLPENIVNDTFKSVLKNYNNEGRLPVSLDYPVTENES